MPGVGEPPPRRNRRLTEVERKRYEQEILNLLRANNGRLPASTIAGHVGIDNRSSKQNYRAVYNLLRSMVKRKLLIQLRERGWFMIPEVMKPWNPEVEVPETLKPSVFDELEQRIIDYVTDTFGYDRPFTIADVAKNVEWMQLSRVEEPTAYQQHLHRRNYQRIAAKFKKLTGMGAFKNPARTYYFLIKDPVYRKYENQKSADKPTLKQQVLDYLQDQAQRHVFPGVTFRQLYYAFDTYHPNFITTVLTQLVDEGKIDRTRQGVYTFVSVDGWEEEKKEEFTEPMMPTPTPVPTSDKQVRRITQQWRTRMLLGVATTPLHIREIQEILGLSYNGTSAVLSSLVKKKQAVATSRGYYTLALTTQNQDLYEFFEKVNYTD